MVGIGLGRAPAHVRASARRPQAPAHLQQALRPIAVARWSNCRELVMALASVADKVRRRQRRDHQILSVLDRARNHGLTPSEFLRCWRRGTISFELLQGHSCSTRSRLPRLLQSSQVLGGNTNRLRSQSLGRQAAGRDPAPDRGRAYVQEPGGFSDRVVAVISCRHGCVLNGSRCRYESVFCAQRSTHRIHRQ